MRMGSGVLAGVVEMDAGLGLIHDWLVEERADDEQWLRHCQKHGIETDGELSRIQHEIDVLTRAIERFDAPDQLVASAR